MSFGFKYGVPQDADLVFDVRFLPNPYYIEELKDKTGNEPEVQDYVMENDKGRIFLMKLKDMMEFLIPNYILEGIYFYSGFMFFYNLSRNGKMPGSAQEIRYINRDENTHLWLFRNMILEMKKELPELFTPEHIEILKEMLKEGVRQEIAWGHYVIGNQIAGLTKEMITEYIQYLGNLRFTNLGFDPIYPDQTQEPDSMRWVSQYSNANMVKTDFFEAKSTAYAKSTALIDDL